MLENMRGEITCDQDILSLNFKKRISINNLIKNTAQHIDSLSVLNQASLSPKKVINEETKRNKSSNFDTAAQDSPGYTQNQDPKSDEKSNNKGQTALHKAVLANDYEQVEHLTESGEVDLNTVDSQGNSALYYACSRNFKNIARFLKFEGGLFISEKDTYLYELLKAAEEGDLAKLKLFHNAGADLSGSTSDGANLAHIVEKSDSQDLKKLFAQFQD